MGSNSTTALLAVILLIREIMHYFERRELIGIPVNKGKPPKSRNFLLKGLEKSLKGGD
jgi:hypothetical protein